MYFFKREKDGLQATQFQIVVGGEKIRQQGIEHLLLWMV